MSRYLAYLARSRLISSRYAGNENGRGVANANSLAYYMADVRRFQPQMAAGGSKGGGPHRYPARWLRRLAAELLAAWRAEAARSAAGRGAERDELEGEARLARAGRPGDQDGPVPESDRAGMKDEVGGLGRVRVGWRLRGHGRVRRADRRRSARRAART